MKIYNRTDLACETAIKRKSGEGVIIEESTLFNLPLMKIKLDENGARRIGKSEGEYITLFCGGESIESETEETEALFTVLEELVPKKGKVLVAGLGNENITPDALGTRTVSGVLATAHFTSEREFSELGMREVYVIETGVMAQTGIESAEQIKYITDGICPDCIIAVDSLACSEPERLCKTIQITNTGIAPGSGVKNSRKELSRRTLGIPVIAIGVPTVIDLESLIKDKTIGLGLVMPRNIDIIIKHYARVISKAVNRALNPSLSAKEAEALLM